MSLYSADIDHNESDTFMSIVYQDKIMTTLQKRKISHISHKNHPFLIIKYTCCCRSVYKEIFVLL